MTRRNWESKKAGAAELFEDDEGAADQVNRAVVHRASETAMKRRFDSTIDSKGPEASRNVDPGTLVGPARLIKVRVDRSDYKGCPPPYPTSEYALVLSPSSRPKRAILRCCFQRPRDPPNTAVKSFVENADP